MLLHWNARYFILIGVIQKLMCSTTGAMSSWNKNCSTYGTGECISHTDCTNTSYETRVLEKLMPYRTIIGTILTEGAAITSSIPLLAERACFHTIVLYGCSFFNYNEINTLPMNSSYTTFCGETKHVLHVRVCSTSTSISSRYETILTLSVKVVWSPLQCQCLN
jgi:hypothetical protein